jgi:hypothetical protein
MWGISPYRAGNTFNLGYKNRPVNDVWNKGRCLFWDPYTQSEHHVEFLNVKRGGT